MDLYHAFEAGWGIFELLNVGLVVLASLFAVYILLKRRKTRVLFFAWALDIKRSRKDMDLLLTATILFVLVFSIFTAGEMLNQLAYIIIAQIAGLMSYLLISYVIFRWLRLFLRFV
ncbi:MAG: hypothetical protein OH316_02130 [Candidatus Parvarchaeota archaeon]|nr:hypothetical protein [Candidatus Parvarchaeota archaeon]MCW1301910.1 hypothetical protein [Candidatus Parvarchaeota archaeon]